MRSGWPALLCALLLVVQSAFGAAIDIGKAAGVKAAYLRHIAGLTTWPTKKVGARSSIAIGVMGADPNGVIEPLRARIESSDGLLAQGRRLDLVKLDPPSEASDRATLEAALRPCDLLFLPESNREHWAAIKPIVASLPIVTVSEIEGFARQGGMIEYLIDLDNGRVRMIVNLDAVKRAGIALSSRFLSLESVIVLRERELAE